MNAAEKHALLIGEAIASARREGVNVTLDWEDDDGVIHVSLSTSVHRRQPEGYMKIVAGPFLVEGY
ncbi:MAG TPA: hypothetical protein VIY48_15665 [Candidatus Paceibacterota bacterium]